VIIRTPRAVDIGLCIFTQSRIWQQARGIFPLQARLVRRHFIAHALYQPAGQQQPFRRGKPGGALEKSIHVMYCHYLALSLTLLYRFSMLKSNFGIIQKTGVLSKTGKGWRTHPNLDT
jgi:hypothetical protein